MSHLLRVSLSPAAQLVILTGPVVQIGVAQLGLPASLVGGLVALQMATAVLRPALGRIGDRLQGGSGLLRTALLVQWLGLPLVLLGLLWLGEQWPRLAVGERLLGLAGEALMVMVVGTANQLAQTLQATLLMESLPPAGRPQVVQQLWLWLNGATLLASVLSSALLRQLTQQSLNVQLLSLWGLWAGVLLLVLAPALSAVPEPAGIQTPWPQGAATPVHHPRQQLSRPLILLLLLAHSPLYCQEVLVDPWATRLFGWPLAATTLLVGCWALGTVVGQLWAWRRPVSPQRACVLVALTYGLMGTRALWPVLEVLPIPLLMLVLGLASGWMQLWLAGEVGRRCAGRRVGETVGWLGAAVVVSRSFGVAIAGPLLDGGGALFGLQSVGAFTWAFGSVAILSLGGAWSCRRLQRAEQV